MSLLEGKTAIVTGAAQGIGLAIADRFVAEGASVVIADLNADKAAEAAGSLGERAVGCAANVVEPDDVAAMFDLAESTFGPVDLLVNNAGITRDSTIHKMTLEQFRSVIDVHLQGTWLGMKEALIRMREAGGPEMGNRAVVNLSSMSGKVGNFGQANYAAAKSGIVGMTKTAAREGARYGIRVNAIAPGLIRTDMTAAMPSDILAEKESQVPLGRAGEPEEVAGVALFLCSDLASYVTGITVEVAGGRGM